jgi:hypothetical protein
VTGVALPSPALLLNFAITIAQGGDESAESIARARLLLDIAKELREGSQAPEQPTEAARAAALAAFGARPGSEERYGATTYGDLAADRQAWIPAEASTEVIPLPAQQPMPIPNDRGSVQALVRQDLVERERLGIQRYGTPLQAFNGRDALRDAYEEALDLCCYLRQALTERDVR